MTQKKKNLHKTNKINKNDMVKLGDVKYMSGSVKRWRKEPGNLSNAVYAAFHYAKKFDQKMYIITGNSYMNKVYHISDNLKLDKFGVINNSVVTIGVVYPDGEVYQKNLLYKK